MQIQNSVMVNPHYPSTEADEFRQWQFPRAQASDHDLLRLLSLQLATHHLEGVEELAFIPFRLTRENGTWRSLCWEFQELVNPPLPRVQAINGYIPLMPEVREALLGACAAMEQDRSLQSAVVLSPDNEGSGRHYLYLYVAQGPSEVVGISIEFRGSIDELRRFGRNVCGMLDGAQTVTWQDLSRPFLSRSSLVAMNMIVHAAREATTEQGESQARRSYLDLIERQQASPDRLLDIVYDRAARIYRAIAHRYNAATSEPERRNFINSVAREGPRIVREVLGEH